MTDKPDKDRQKQEAHAVDPFTAATAIGFAVASRTMEMWFGAMSGFARASREIMAPHLEAQWREAGKADAAEPASARDSAADTPSNVANFPLRKPPGKRAAAAKPTVEAAPAALPARPPRAVDRPDTLDDLKRISGIGPKLEQVLNGYGLWTFAQIADLQPEEMAWLDDLLGLNGRIADDKWLEQARTLGRAGIEKRDFAAG